MKFTNDFESFLKTEVNLNEARIDTLQDRVDAVETFISGNSLLGPMFLDLIPTGSWAHRTIIKPVGANDEFDADVLLHVTAQAGWLPKDYVENLFKAFRDDGTYASLAILKSRCVRIDYAGDFHIDVVPYLDLNLAHVVTDRTTPENVGSFELSNPERFTEWIDERQRLTNSTFVKVVRLVKYLRDYKNTFECKSIILTTLLGNQISLRDAANYTDVPSTLMTLMTRLSDSLPESMPAIMDPAGTGDNFSERYSDSWNYENFRKCVISYAEKMREAFEETDPARSIKSWQSVWGTNFKPGQLVKAATLEPLSVSVPWQGESFIDQPPFSLPIRLDPQYTAHITGCVTGAFAGRASGATGFHTYDLAMRGNRVRKGRDLEFAVTTTVPSPDAIYWKVRNGGSEAAAARQLRGEITRTSGRVKSETTKYAGRHYVECYIVKNGVVVARDRQDVVVTLS